MNKLLATEIGKRIKICRDTVNLTQEELAAEMGISPHQVSNIERGTNLISLESLIKASQVFNVPTDYLIHGKSVNDQRGSRLSEKYAEKEIRLNMLFDQIAALFEDDNEESQ